jgi:antitoxin (DNA-binding transcriptional repressor) of toxin-antitoxin stability system
MLKYSIYEAKPKLSELAGMAEIGCTVFITRYGKPIAKLVRVEPEDLLKQEEGKPHDEVR